MPVTLTPKEETDIASAVRAVFSQMGQGQHRPVATDVISNRFDSPWPLWPLLCHAVMHQRRFCPSAQALMLCQRLASDSLLLDTAQIDAQVPEPDSQRPCTPSQMAQLVASLAPRPGLTGRAPQCLQDDLIVQALNASPGLDDRPDLDLTQLLVRPWLGAQDQGGLARLELWKIPAASLHRPKDFGSLVRAPGAAMLRIDQQFADGLNQVQRLMQQVLGPQAPAIAWNLRALAETDRPYPPPLPAVTGPSATAALAYGVLFLLRDHLLPQHQAQRAWLQDSAPQAITITGALDGPSAAAADFRWPHLVRIDFADDKFSALQRLPTNRQVTHRYVAHQQHANAPQLQATGVIDLAALVARVGQDCGSGLDGDGRNLHDLLLQQDDQPITDMVLLERVANPKAAPTSIKAYLVWRYAYRASGAHRAFGDPVRLDQQFVRLVLHTDQDLADDHPHAKPGAPRPPVPPVELKHLLDEPKFKDVPAWCVEAPPFTGKTTLLSAWEMHTARAALQRWQKDGQWGEVCVFLPMRAFAPPPLAQHADDGQRGQVVAAFQAFFRREAPGLPPLQDLATGSSRQPGLQLRLLVDGLNELRSPDFDQRQAVMTVLCTWMHAHQHGLRPPALHSAIAGKRAGSGHRRRHRLASPARAAATLEPQ